MIQDDYPSYNPLAIALRNSQIDESLLDAACDRVYIDGYYGPCSDQEWEETDGRKPYSVKEALGIMGQVYNEIEDFTMYADGLDEYQVDRSDIARALWPWLIEIYGGLPF
jgi:hypothetical protein